MVGAGAAESPVACTDVADAPSRERWPSGILYLPMASVKASFQGVPRLFQVLMKNLREAVSQDCLTLSCHEKDVECAPGSSWFGSPDHPSYAEEAKRPGSPTKCH